MPINLALIGCGQIASAHIKAAHTLANTELLFAIDSDLERARQTAIDHNIPHYSTDYAQALASPEVDAVLLCLPHDLHHPFALQAAAAGKHARLKNRWPSMQQKRKRWQQPPPPAYSFLSASLRAVFPLTSKPKCYWHKTPSARCSISSTSAPFGSTSFLQTGAAINRPAAAFTCPSLAVTTSTPCSGKPI